MDTNSSFCNIINLSGFCPFVFFGLQCHRSGTLRHLKPEIWNLTCPELASGNLKPETNLLHHQLHRLAAFFGLGFGEVISR
jgi:hypothetical protein